MSEDTETISVRITANLLERIQKLKGKGQSDNAFVIEAIEKALESLGE